MAARSSPSSSRGPTGKVPFSWPRGFARRSNSRALPRSRGPSRRRCPSAWPATPTTDARRPTSSPGPTSRCTPPSTAAATERSASPISNAPSRSCPPQSSKIIQEPGFLCSPHCFGGSACLRLEDQFSVIYRGHTLIIRGRPARRENVESVSSLKESDDRFRVLVESIRDYAVFMLDRNGRVATWNTGAALIKGYQREEILGKPIDLFYTREDRENGRPARLLAQAANEGRIEDEGWRVRKDGTRFWADVVITALRNEAGALIGYTKVTRDLTQRLQAEQERRRLDADRIRAEEALRIRDEFLSIASHELKTPLTALQLELYGMRAPIERHHDERLGRKLSRASRSADRLSRLIEMLLDVSRIAAGQLTLKREPFDL